MSIYRTDAEQDWRDHAEGLYDPDVIVENLEVARLDGMSWPTAEIAVERVRPASVPQPEFEPRHTVRSHEVPNYGPMSVTDWIFLIGGVALCVAWLMLLAAVMYAVTVG